MSGILALLSCLFLSFNMLATQSLDSIIGSSTDSYLYDSYGRVRFFHGIQSVQKQFPWYENWVFNQTQINLYASWGFNIMRVGWMWSGFEPAQDQFNYTYAKMMQQVVANNAAAGIYSLLDAHQDCFSSKFCLYDGIPLWVADKSVPREAFPWPMGGNCSSRNWELNCLTEAAGQAYQDLYDNTNGMLDDFIQFWSKSSQFWTGNKNVIGYELINEPFAGDVYADPLLFLPGNAGRWNLQPTYEKVAPAIRQFDEQHLIFYEPVTWGMLLDGKIVGSGFTDVPGGQAYRNRSVLSYHYYCASFGGYRFLCDDILGPEMFRAVAADVAGFGGSSMLTEFGNQADGAPEVSAVMDLADDAQQSWIYWGGMDTVPGEALKRDMVRTYAQAVAGKPLSMSFNTDTAAFSLCYVVDRSISKPTQIFVPFEYRYNGKPKVSTTPNVAATLNNKLNQILILSKSGGTACVNITN